jgi:Zn finger protein HypA/HybF involved in hydrogenase expression
MAKIHWLAWLTIGGVVTYVSAQIGESFVLFFYVGLIFLAIGTFSALIAFITRKKATKAEKAQVQAQVRPVQRYVCPHCRHPVTLQDQFCSQCGTRLR